MLEAASAGLREIWRRICRQISRPHLNPSLPFPAHPRGRVSGVVPGTLQLPPEPQRTLLDELIDKILSRLPQDRDCRERGARVIAKLRALVGDLPASAAHHHSGRFGLLQHSLEVALKMLEESTTLPVTDHPFGGNVGGLGSRGNGSRGPYLRFLAGLCHDLGKLLEMEVRQGQRQWCPLQETYADFLREANGNPVMGWREDRVRGAHALFSPWIMHHVLSQADIEYLGCEGLSQLMDAMVGTHNASQSSRFTSLLRRLDQESVEEAAPDWMRKRPDSKVNQFVRALRTLIEEGGLGVNRVGKPVYVSGQKTAVVVPVAIQLARDLLKQEKIMLPGNIHLYDLLSQSRLVEADSAGRCVHRIKVPGKHGPVELRALIFATETIVPKQMIPTLPNFSFEIKPEEPKHGN